jgi:hypothetical protein
LNFDTRIQQISTDEAIQSAMDGTLTREEVESLVEQGLNIQRQTTLGKRAGLSFAVHLGERVDFDVNMMLGAGHAGALSLGAGLVLRWDAMVHALERDHTGAQRERGGDAGSSDAEVESCEALAARYHRFCRLRRDAPAPGANPAAPRPRTGSPRRQAPRMREPAPTSRQPRAPVRAPSSAPSPAPVPLGTPAASGSTTPTAKKPPPAAPVNPGTPPAVPRPKPGELPPLQAAPPRTP